MDFGMMQWMQALAMTSYSKRALYQPMSSSPMPTIHGALTWTGWLAFRSVPVIGVLPADFIDCFCADVLIVQSSLDDMIIF